MNAEPLRIAVVAGPALVRAGIADALGEAAGVEVVACVATWGEVPTEADAAIVDAASAALPGAPRPPAVALLPDDADPARWLRRGIGVLPARAPPAAIAAAAQAAAAGLVAAPPRWFGAALPAVGQAPAEALTPREHEVLRHLAQGRANREIGALLAISEHTAKFHVAQIIAKLDASSRGHAVAKALRAGLLADA